MEEVEEEGEVPRAVGNGDAPKKQRKSGRLGANNGGNALERSFTLRDRDKAAHVREIGKQELAISGTNEGENERETREKRKRNLVNLKFKHRNPDLARSRSTIINEECLGKYDAVTFDPKTKEQVDVKLKVGEAQTSFFPASHDDSDREIISTLTPRRRTLKLKISWESQRT